MCGFVQLANPLCGPNTWARSGSGPEEPALLRFLLLCFMLGSVYVWLLCIRKSRAEDAGNFEGQVDLQKWGIYIRQYGM